MASNRPIQHSFDDLAVWRTSLPDVKYAVLPPSSDRPNPRLGDGLLFVSVFSPGSVSALAASTREICWRRELPYLSGKPVQLSGGVLFAKTAQTLYALDPVSGNIRWEFCPYGLKGETIYSEPTVDGNRVFIGDRKGWLHCLDAETGQTVWKQETSDQVNATAVVVGGLVITSNNDGLALAYSIESGQAAWQCKLDGPCIHHLFFVNGQVVVATESLYFLEPATGEVQGRLQWPGKAVDFVTGMPSQVAVLRQQTRDERERNLAGGQPPLEPEALLVYERTRLIHEIQCSRYSHAVRFCPATGLLYASGLHALDIINPVTREWLHTLRVDKNAVYGLPDVAQQMIYALTEKGAVYAMRHP